MHSSPSTRPRFRLPRQWRHNRWRCRCMYPLPRPRSCSAKCRQRSIWSNPFFPRPLAHLPRRLTRRRNSCMFHHRSRQTRWLSGSPCLHRRRTLQRFHSSIHWRLFRLNEHRTRGKGERAQRRRIGQPGFVFLSTRTCVVVVQYVV